MRAPRLWPLYVLGLVLSASCKETSVTFEEGDDAGVVLARRSGNPEFFASDAAALQKNANFFFRVWDEGFSRRLDDLPREGEVPDAKKPLPGGYYPEQGGGTNVAMVGGKSPLQKYDEAFHGGQNKAAQWEIDKHTGGPDWAGHCNGYSAAAQRHPKEPSKPVVRGGVTFDPRDIKALMAEIHMNADYEFLGGNRCDREGNVPGPGSRTDPKVMNECEDINPGTLHAAVVNWIGRMHHTVIMDEFSGDQVWNYPLFKYQVVTQEAITKAQAKQLVIGQASGDYIFNPAAVKFVNIRTKLFFGAAQRHEVLGGRDAQNRVIPPGEMELTYVLELNGEGEILGGEWTGQSQTKHPDFLWVALPPLQPNGTRYMGNEHLSNTEVIKMWAESAGFDPENPPLDIERPPNVDDWGRFPSFEVVLDGGKTGAVFGGKKTMMKITRRDSLASGNVTLELLLNGNTLATLTAKPNEDVTHGFDPGIGMNRLQFLWKKDGVQVEDQFLRFHVVR